MLFSNYGLPEGAKHPVLWTVSSLKGPDGNPRMQGIQKLSFVFRYEVENLNFRLPLTLFNFQRKETVIQ